LLMATVPVDFGTVRRNPALFTLIRNKIVLAARDDHPELRHAAAVWARWAQELQGLALGDCGRSSTALVSRSAGIAMGRRC
jgi:hypothetical protein